MLFTFGFGIEFPERGPGITVQRGYQVFRCARVQNIADLQRCVFIYTRAGTCGATTCSVGPGNLQVLDVVRGDLRVRSKPCSRGITPKELPVFRGVGGLFGLGCVSGGDRVRDPAVRVERSNKCRDQCKEYGKPEPVSGAPGAQGRVRQRGADPQTECQDDGRNDQTWQQFPIAELTHFIKGPGTGRKEYGNREGNTQTLAQHKECRQCQISQACDQVIT